MDDASLQSLIQAINTLQSSPNLEDRMTADKWLRSWQISPEAWEGTVRLLSEGSLSYEVHLMAAILLRTKLLYDFVQLPVTAHETLCNSLFTFIETFRHSPQKAILKTLALGFADLSIHISRSWGNFLDTLCERLYTSSRDTEAWLCCLSAFPQESMKEKLLADPDDVKAHTNILISKFPWVSTHIMTILQSPGVQVNIALEALECFSQWATFIFKTARSTHTTLFPPLISDMYFKLAETKCQDPNFSDRIAECLSQVVWLASKMPEGHDALLTKTLEELASPTGHIRLALVNALDADEEATTLRLANIYTDACCGCCEKLTLLFWHGEAFVKELLGIFLRLTSISFSFEDEMRGSSGIASTTLEFWDYFIVKIVSQTRKLQQMFLSPNANKTSQYFGASDTNVHHGDSRDVFLIEMISHGSLDQTQFRNSISELTILFDLLLRTLIQLCYFPADVLGETQASSLYEFHRFRHSIVNTFLQLCRVYTPENLLVKLTESFASLSSDSSCMNKEIAQEAHLYLMGQLLKRKGFKLSNEYSHDSVIESDGDGSDEETLPCLFNAVNITQSDLLDTLSKLFQSLPFILVSTPSATLCNCLTRVSACELLYGAALQQLLNEKTEGIHHILECLAQQVFHGKVLEGGANIQQEIITGTVAGSENGSRNSLVTLESSLYLLADTASDALRQLCCSSEDTAFLNYLLNQLYPTLCMFPKLHEKSYCNILKGLAVIVVGLPLDADFFQWSTKLLNPYVVTSTTSSDAMQICIQLDRISLILQGLSSQKQERRGFLGNFLVSKLWPLVDHLWETYPQSSIIVECGGRMIKHGVRCVTSSVFKSLLPFFVSRVISNAKICLHSTFMYIAEWLITEYVDDMEACATLQILFEELTRIGVITLQNQLKEAKQLDGNLVEDFFGLFSRSLRFQPTIPATSQALPEAFALVTPFLHHSSVIAVSMTCAFIENSVLFVCSNVSENEAGSLSVSNPALDTAVANVNMLLVKHLHSIVMEIFHVLSDIPSKTVLRLFSGVLWEFRLGYPAELRNALIAAVDSLPGSVVPSERYKNTVIENILQEDLYGQMGELYDRWRRANLRRCEANAIGNA